MSKSDIDPVEFIEQYFGIELMECQKTMLRKIEDEKIYLYHPRHCGYLEYKEISELCGLVKRNMKI